MTPRAKYSSEDIRAAVVGARSFAEVLSRLGLRPAGGNYKHLRQRLTELDIDYSHLAGQAWARGRITGPKRPITDYLVEDPQLRTASAKLKRRLLREGFFAPRCSTCQLSEWMGRPIPLELDHINGRNYDNRLPNLRLLCPNCHALTPTYRGRNIGSY